MTAHGRNFSSTGPTFGRSQSTPRSSPSPSSTDIPSPPSTASLPTARKPSASPRTGSIRPAMIGLLFPRFDHPAIEERYASWQCQMLLRRDVEVEFCRYDPEEPASFAAGDLESDHVLVITDPLLVPPPKLALRLREALVQSPGTAAALPVSNEADNPAQRRAAPAAYLTLRELQQMTTELQHGPFDTVTVKWDKSDPAAYLCRTAMLDDVDDPPRRALAGRQVVVSRTDY